MEAKLKGLDPQKSAGGIVIPAATLRSRVKSAKAVAEKMRKLALLYLDGFKRKMGTEKNNTLTSEIDKDYIQQLIAHSDLKNNVMPRSEVIDIIQNISGADFVKANNHWYYLWREKLFPELKNHGVLQLAQAKTTKRIGAITEKFLRWHGTIGLTLNHLYRRNYWHIDWEDIKLPDNIDSFWGNVDETSMSVADGTLT